MRELNDKIRNGIANSYYLRSLAKDDRLSREERNKAYENVKLINEKIIFYKGISNALKELENDKKHR
jgi:hypothetical protein